MKSGEIDWRSGQVTYWGLDALDAAAPLAAQLSELGEDLVQVTYANRVLIDVGWYPSFSADGGFAVVVVRDEEWERPLSQERCVSVEALRICLRRAVDIATKAEGAPVTAASPVLRVARPSDDLEALLPFYRDGLGLTLLGRFDDHDGFSGIILGGEGAPYHLEFVRAEGHKAGRAPTEDNLLVFYLPDHAAWSAAVARMKAAGFSSVSAFNPYWDARGVTFEDPDGYRVVLQNAAWPR